MAVTDTLVETENGGVFENFVSVDKAAVPALKGTLDLVGCPVGVGSRIYVDGDNGHILLETVHINEIVNKVELSKSDLTNNWTSHAYKFTTTDPKKKMPEVIHTNNPVVQVFRTLSDMLAGVNGTVLEHEPMNLAFIQIDTDIGARFRLMIDKKLIVSTAEEIEEGQYVRKGHKRFQIFDVDLKDNEIYLSDSIEPVNIGSKLVALDASKQEIDEATVLDVMDNDRMLVTWKEQQADRVAYLVVEGDAYEVDSIAGGIVVLKEDVRPLLEVGDEVTTEAQYPLTLVWGQRFFRVGDIPHSPQQWWNSVSAPPTIKDNNWSVVVETDASAPRPARCTSSAFRRSRPVWTERTSRVRQQPGRRAVR